MEQIKINRSRFQNKEVDDLLKEELLKIKQDPLVYPVLSEQLKLSQKEAETYVGALMDLRDDMHYCASCPGLEACMKDHPHFQLKLTRDGAVIDRHYDPCEKMLSLASFKRRYVRCSFPEEWRDDDLRDIEKSKSSREQTIRKFIKIAAGSSSDWAYLIGNSGSGKSYMLACLANTISKKNGVGAYIDTAATMEELKYKIYNDRAGFEDLFGKLVSASILVLDDFGNEFKSEFQYTSILFPLLSARDKAGLPTAFASDFTMESIVSMYASKIGPERANQFRDLLKRRCGKELDVTGFAIH